MRHSLQYFNIRLTKQTIGNTQYEYEIPTWKPYGSICKNHARCGPKPIKIHKTSTLIKNYAFWFLVWLQIFPYQNDITQK